jgi:copper chaperone
MYNFQVNDMTCGHCVGTIENAVKGVDATGKVAIDSSKPAESFARAIEEAGYTGELLR